MYAAHSVQVSRTTLTQCKELNLRLVFFSGVIFLSQEWWYLCGRGRRGLIKFPHLLGKGGRERAIERERARERERERERAGERERERERETRTLHIHAIGILRRPHKTAMENIHQSPIPVASETLNDAPIQPGHKPNAYQESDVLHTIKLFRYYF